MKLHSDELNALHHDLPDLPDDAPVEDVVSRFINDENTSPSTIRLLCGILASRSDFYWQRFQAAIASESAEFTDMSKDCEILIDKGRLQQYIANSEWNDEAADDVAYVLNMVGLTDGPTVSVKGAKLFSAIIPSHYTLDVKDHRDYLTTMLIENTERIRGHSGSPVPFRIPVPEELVHSFDETYRNSLKSGTPMIWKDRARVALVDALANLLPDLTFHEIDTAVDSPAMAGFELGYSSQLGEPCCGSCWLTQIRTSIESACFHLPDDLKEIITGMIEPAAE